LFQSVPSENGIRIGTTTGQPGDIFVQFVFAMSILDDSLPSVIGVLARGLAPASDMDHLPPVLGLAASVRPFHDLRSAHMFAVSV